MSNSKAQPRIRVVQWTTGKVATQSIKAILERPNLELVGLYAWSPEKAGKDVGELIGLGRTLGIQATHDIDALIALQPDVVAYMPLHPDVSHMAKLLHAGIDVVTTASFITGRGYGAEAKKILEDAALAGGASLFGSGINPGWVDSWVASASSACKEVNLVRITESFNIGMWAGDANQDVIGWGRPANDPGHAADLEKATLPFGDAVEAVAHMFDFTLDEVRCETEFAHATQDLDLPGRPVKKGTVAGVVARWLGIAGGVPVIELNAQWTLSDDITPPWDIGMAYNIEIRGTPQIKLRAEVLPDDMSLPMEELIATGFIITALPVVNAIPAVFAARPGIVTYADLRPITSVLRPGKDRTLSALALREETPSIAPKAVLAADGAVNAEGTWNVTIKGPTGPQHTVLVLERSGDGWTGTQSGQGQSSPILEVKLDGSAVSWVNIVTKPMKLKVEFKGTIDGATMSGKAKAGFMGSFPFTATKA